jgi:hypothetical protein
MPTETSPVRAAPALDARALLPGALCVGAPFVDGIGWLLAVAGLVLLRRAPVRVSTKLLLAAVAVAPKLLFVVIRWTTAPSGLSIVFEPWTLATSASPWAWSSLLVVLGVLMARQSRRPTWDPQSSPEPPRRSLLPLVVGLVLMAAGGLVLLQPLDGFHRIDDAGGGRWALKHAARGTVATFTRAELAAIEGTENHGSKGGSTDTVRVRLTDGRSYSLTSKSSGVFKALRVFATTANLPPGAARITRWRGPTWQNGAPGYTLHDFAGSFEYTDPDTKEHSLLQLSIVNDRLVGEETVENGDSRHVRTLEHITANDTGELECSVATKAEARQVGPDTTAFHLQWSPTGDSGRLTKDGFDFGVKKFRRR